MFLIILYEKVKGVFYENGPSEQERNHPPPVY